MNMAKRQVGNQFKKKADRNEKVAVVGSGPSDYLRI